MTGATNERIRRKLSFQSALMTIMLLNLTVFIAAILLFLFLNDAGHGRIAHLWAWTSGGLLVTFAAIMGVFYKKIYVPIMKIEKALEILENNETDFARISDGEVFPIMDSLSKMLNRLKTSMDREHAAEMLKRQSELSALQNQINPHFLYNTLEAIRGEALIHENLEIAEMTEAIARFFRYSISKKGDFVTLKDELDNVRNYILIQQYRFDDKLAFRVTLDDLEDDMLKCVMPKLTMQPIVENAIYHGLETKLGSGEIRIRVTATQDRLIIHISDNGLGMDKDALERLSSRLRQASYSNADQETKKHSGIALINVDQRLKLYFGEAYGITISSTLSLGTDVEILLPIVTDPEKIPAI